MEVVDYAHSASFRVVPFYEKSPDEGGFAMLTNPEDLRASPTGWLGK